MRPELSEVLMEEIVSRRSELESLTVRIESDTARRDILRREIASLQLTHSVLNKESAGAASTKPDTDDPPLSSVRNSARGRAETRGGMGEPSPPKPSVPGMRDDLATERGPDNGRSFHNE